MHRERFITIDHTDEVENLIVSMIFPEKEGMDRATVVLLRPIEIGERSGIVIKTNAQKWFHIFLTDEDASFLTLKYNATIEWK